MAEIVNLRQLRKSKAREDRSAEAERDRILHGRSKTEKQRERLEAERAANFVEGHRREPAPDSKPPSPDRN